MHAKSRNDSRKDPYVYVVGIAVQLIVVRVDDGVRHSTTTIQTHLIDYRLIDSIKT